MTDIPKYCPGCGADVEHATPGRDGRVIQIRWACEAWSVLCNDGTWAYLPSVVCLERQGDQWEMAAFCERSAARQERIEGDSWRLMARIQQEARERAEADADALQARWDARSVAYTEMQVRVEKAEAQLCAVDELLARRAALDELPDRLAKIGKALRVAKEAEAEVQALQARWDERSVAFIEMEVRVEKAEAEVKRLQDLCADDESEPVTYCPDCGAKMETVVSEYQTIWHVPGGSRCRKRQKQNADDIAAAEQAKGVGT